MGSTGAAACLIGPLAVGADDPRDHLRAGIDAASRMFVAERDLYRVLFSMAQLDPSSVGATVRRMDDDRSGGMAHLVARLVDGNLLRDDISPSDAEHVLWMLTSFESFDALVTGRGVPVEHAIDLLVSSAERTLLRDTAIPAR